MALADTLSLSSQDQQALQRAERYQSLPEIIRQEIVAYGAVMLHFLEQHLLTIDANDASYDMLFTISNQMRDALELLNLR